MAIKININKQNRQTDNLSNSPENEMILDLKHIQPVDDENENALPKEAEKIIETIPNKPADVQESLPESEKEETREEEIEDSLSEIYHDDDGRMVDVHKLEVKKTKGFWFYFFMILSFVSLSYIGLGAYDKYSHLINPAKADKIMFSVEGKNKVIAGEEFLYTVNYGNENSAAITDIKINVVYPDDYIFLESSVDPITSSSTKTAQWHFDRLGPGQSGKIEIKGKLIKPVGTASVVLADIAYRPEKFTTDYKKTASFDTETTGIGINFAFDNFSSVLVGQDSSIGVSFKPEEKSYLGSFQLSINSLENMELLPNKTSKRPGVWQIEELDEGGQTIDIGFKFKEKKNPVESVSIRVEHFENNVSYLILEKVIEFEIMKNNLNLNLIINGAGGDQGVNFGQGLNYSINYSNKGDNTMRDIVIMAVLQSDFLDWQSLSDQSGGKVKNGTITWDKGQIPGLESLASGQEGVIDFSINVASSTKPKSGRVYQIKSYAQFSIGRIGDDASSTPDMKVEANKDTRSNIITNKINSNLDLVEDVRYFNDDNIAVGTGPLPPKVGEATTFKVYWQLSNSLHELRDLKIECVLPDYVSWDDKNLTSVGTIEYDSASRKVIWNIGRLPISDYDVKSEFTISLTPDNTHADKIMVLLPGSKISAFDTETNSEIGKTTAPRTTKLENDLIATGMGNDGRVVR